MNKQTTILIAIMVLLGGVYWYFFTGNEPEVSLSATDPTDPTEQEFLNLASKLSSISFETNLFSDPRFTALVDLSTPIRPESQGRPDPFAPFGL
ncbi:MAG: hypothetical protein Q7R54_01275 [bacterium]|nr:hypothetical protein [bacterium]